ncbi:unnamed protein product [Chrysodeixis includens]|uniref:Uncharacterized protein n=1 Tax=Chrysodeixis includens TaxID=689277 RepID=A0A9N8L0B5_CHRIL|nr:unnamed protein product [Chrysodeixis includens]
MVQRSDPGGTCHAWRRSVLAVRPRTRRYSYREPAAFLPPVAKPREAGRRRRLRAAPYSRPPHGQKVAEVSQCAVAQWVISRHHPPECSAFNPKVTGYRSAPAGDRSATCPSDSFRSPSSTRAPLA